VIKKAKIESPIAELIAMIVVVLMATGAVFVFSAGTSISNNFDIERFYDYSSLRQIIFFPIACLIMYVTSRLDYRRLSLEKGWSRNPIVYCLAISITLLIALLIQKAIHIFPEQIVPKVNEHYRWIKIPLGGFTISFQPSELAKWSMIFLLAAFCAKSKNNLDSFRNRFIPICILIGFVAALVIVEDFGTAAFIALLAFLLLIIGGATWWHILVPVPFAASAFAFILLHSRGRMERILAFLHPEKWEATINYQPNQSLIALGSGGLWGKGLGRGISKYGWLPEDTTDFIFAIVGEEFGFAGNVIVIALFIFFTILGILLITRCKDRFGKILAAGIVLAISIQAVFNIGVVTVVLPNKGIPLPFVSAGGTSILLSAAAIGVLLNIARQTAAEAADRFA
jgi:cell division protein FtsW